MFRKEMSGYNIGYIGIFAQSFAAFVGLTVLLGRIYSLSYYETMGIPSSSIRLSIIDYSIVSPDVTVLGVGLVIAITSILFFPPNSFFGTTETTKRKRIAIGGVMIVIGAIVLIAMLVAVAIFHNTILNLPKGAIGMLWAASFISCMLGAVILGAATNTVSHGGEVGSEAVENSATLGVTEKLQDLHRQLNLNRLLLFLSTVAIITLASYLLLMFSAALGQYDAQRSVISAPIAQIEFTPQVERVLDYPDCIENMGDCRFTVIHITDSYVFMRLIDSQDSSYEERRTQALKDEQMTYAYPHGAISNIVYIVGLEVSD